MQNKGGGKKSVALLEVGDFVAGPFLVNVNIQKIAFGHHQPSGSEGFALRGLEIQCYRDVEIIIAATVLP